MSAGLIVLAWLPALALALGYPRRPAGAAAVAGAAALGAFWALGLPEELRRPALMAAAWALLGSLWACLLSARGAREGAALESMVDAARARAAESAKRLVDLRERGLQAEREQKQTLALYGMLKSLSDAITWDDIRPKLESAAEQYMGVTAFSFYIGGKDSLRLLTARGLEGSAGGKLETLERMLQERGLSVAQAFFGDSPESAIGLPIEDNGELLGYFYARAPRGETTQALLGKAQSFAQEIAFAFRRIRLFQEVDELSRIDGLTGVHRRGAFDERLRHELVRAKTFKTSVGLMLLDIDHFKSLNDRHGHPFGDQVLRRVGEILNSSVYETDFVARYGGEEFAILLPRADPEGAARKAEMIRRAIEAEKFTVGFETVRVTISIGLAHHPRDAASAEELVSRADAALYRAKDGGRNQVVDAGASRKGA